MKKKKPVQPKREVNLFDMSDKFGQFQEPFDNGSFGKIPKAARRRG